MGLFLTLLYILTAYMAPSTIFGELVQYHIEMVIAVFALIGSLLASEKPPLLEMPQTWALTGLAAAIFLSLAANGFLSGAVLGLIGTLPSLFAFVFIVLNCRTGRHLKMLIIVLLSVCLFITLQGYLALSAGDTTSPFLLAQGDDAGGVFYRLVGLGFINDPNDLSQVIVALIPLLFFFWRPKNGFANTLFVLVPTGILLFGLYLAHSRGATLALLVMIVLAGRRKIGTVPSAVIAAGLFAITMAIGWTGNRGVSVEAGADRLGAWSAGLEMIKTHPIFGVGFARYGEFYTLTAHNSVIVCAAEIGLFGLFPWLLFVCTSIWEALAVSGYLSEKKQVAEEMNSVHGVRAAFANTPLANAQGWGAMANLQKATSPAPLYRMNASIAGAAMLARNPMAMHLQPVEQEDPEAAAVEEVRRFGRLMIISLAGFLTAGWFLSRAFQMSVFVYCGIAQVIYQLALDKKIVPAKPPMKKLAGITAVSGVALVIIVYVMLRAEHMMGIH